MDGYVTVCLECLSTSHGMEWTTLKALAPVFYDKYKVVMRNANIDVVGTANMTLNICQARELMA